MSFSNGVRQFAQVFSRWGLVEYGLLLALWSLLAFPLWLGGRGVLALLTLPASFVGIGLLSVWLSAAMPGPPAAAPVDALDALHQHLGHLPANLVAYFEAIADGTFANRAPQNLHLFTPAQVLEHSRHFVDRFPLFQALGALILDDPNTSNHHFYFTQGPLRGAVFYLSHDGESRVVFPSLKRFLDIATAARDAETFNWEAAHPPLAPLAADQAGLGVLIDAALADGHTGTLPALIPSLDLRDTALLARFIEHKDLFLAEAVAQEIARRPAHALQALAQRCAAHTHPQVAEAGQRACAAIAALDKAAPAAAPETVADEAAAPIPLARTTEGLLNK